MNQERIQYEAVIFAVYLVFWMAYIVDMRQERKQYEEVYLIFWAVYSVFGMVYIRLAQTVAGWQAACEDRQNF